MKRSAAWLSYLVNPLARAELTPQCLCHTSSWTCAHSSIGKLIFCLQNPYPKQIPQHKIRSFWVLLLVAPNRASPNASRALQQGAQVRVNTSTPFLFDTPQLGHGFEGYTSPGALRQRKSNQKNSWSASATSWQLVLFYRGPDPFQLRLF